MFQMEIVEGQEVFACNICDKRFDFIVEANKHIADAHEDILNHILTRINDEIERNNHETEKYESEFELEKTEDACKIEIVNGVSVFKCNWCKESFISVDNLKKHFKDKH